MRYVGARCRAPLAHGVRVFAGKGFYRGRSTAVRVALTQYRVYSAAQYFAITGGDIFFFVSLGIFFIFRDLITLLVQLFDGRAQLRDRGGNVRQFNDVGVRIFGVFTQFGQSIGHALVFCEVVREVGQDTGRQ